MRVTNKKLFMRKGCS